MSTPKVKTGELAWRPLGEGGRWQSDRLPINRDANATYLSIAFVNSLERSLLSTIYRPGSVWIEYLDTKGKVLHHYRFIPQAGLDMLIWPLVLNTDDLADHLLHAAPESSPRRRIRPDGSVAIRFVSNGSTPPFRRSRYRLESFVPGEG